MCSPALDNSWAGVWNGAEQRKAGSCRHLWFFTAAVTHLLIWDQYVHQVGQKVSFSIHSNKASWSQKLTAGTAAEEPSTKYFCCLSALKKLLQITNPPGWGKKAFLLKMWGMFEWKTTDHCFSETCLQSRASGSAPVLLCRAAPPA